MCRPSLSVMSRTTRSRADGEISRRAVNGLRERGGGAAANVASPRYLAVMECEPAIRAEMETEACFALRVVVPMTFAPSKNWTVPLGVPVAVTVAVKVTDCPVTDGFAEEATAVLVVWPVPLTVCVNAADVLTANVASPRYLAVMECEPAARAEVETEACFALSVAVPMTFAPSRNWMVPVGVPWRSPLP